MQKYIKIHPADKVAVALCPLAAGTEVTIENQTLILTEDIPQGHKFALEDLSENQPVIKYGYPIGITKEAVKAGSWIHVHNMKTGLGDLLINMRNRTQSLLLPKNGSSRDTAVQTARQAYATNSGLSLL